MKIKCDQLLIQLLAMTGNEKLTIRKNPTRTTVNKISFEGKEFNIFPWEYSPKTKYSKVDGMIVKKELITNDEITIKEFLIHKSVLS